MDWVIAMTNKVMTETTGRLTPAVLCLLNRVFPGQPIGEARIQIVPKSWWHNRDAACNSQGPVFLKEKWHTTPAWALLIHIAHELDHWLWLRSHRLGMLRWWLNPWLAKELEVYAIEREKLLKWLLSDDELRVLDREV